MQFNSPPASIFSMKANKISWFPPRLRLWKVFLQKPLLTNRWGKHSKRFALKKYTAKRPGHFVRTLNVDASELSFERREGFFFFFFFFLFWGGDPVLDFVVWLYWTHTGPQWSRKGKDDFPTCGGLLWSFVDLIFFVTVYTQPTCRDQQVKSYFFFQKNNISANNIQISARVRRIFLFFSFLLLK